MNNCLTLPSSNDDIFDNICNDEMNDLVTESSTEAMDKISKVMTKIKYSAFGKVKIKNTLVNKDEDENQLTLVN